MYSAPTYLAGQGIHSLKTLLHNKHSVIDGYLYRDLNFLRELKKGWRLTGSWVEKSTRQKKGRIHQSGHFSEKGNVYSTMARVLSHSVISDSLWPHWLQPSSLLCPWNFPGKNAGVGCHFLLQGIFLTQGSNPYLLRFLCQQVDSLPLSHLRSPLQYNGMEVKKHHAFREGQVVPHG